MDSDTRKKDLFYIIVLILTLISLLIATFAYYYLVASQSDEGTKINTGKLEINYIDGYTVSNAMFVPIYEPTLETNNAVIKKNFTISSTGTLDQTITVYFNSLVNTFSDKVLKYAIYNSNGEKMKKGSINREGETELITNIYLSSTGTATYTVLIWLEETNLDQEQEKNKYLTGNFRILSEQIKY